jgi:hypothetical protein
VIGAGEYHRRGKGGESIRLIDDIAEETDAGDLMAHDQDDAAVGADAEVAGFDEVEVFGGAGVVGIVDIGIDEEEGGGGGLLEGADVDEGALGVEDNYLSEKEFQPIGGVGVY